MNNFERFLLSYLSGWFIVDDVERIPTAPLGFAPEWVAALAMGLVIFLGLVAHDKINKWTPKRTSERSTHNPAR